MRPTLCPRLINGPLADPALYIDCRHQSRALLFDCGETSGLTPREILKISDIFISHTHMDHFSGFDRILRLTLGRGKTLRIYGPPGFLENLGNKLGAYTWNLVHNYSAGLVIVAAEVNEEHQLSRRYPCQSGFQPLDPDHRQPFSGIITREPGYTFSARILDHQIPCLAFAVQENFHINIIRNGLDELGLVPGPWLQHFKAALYRLPKPRDPFRIPAEARLAGKATEMAIENLSGQIARITAGMKIAYIVDAAWTPSNVDRMLDLARNADHLFIEGAFAHRHRSIAREKAHLTARQAGIIAGRAGAKRFTLFHFSPRYSGREADLVEEAQQAYSEESPAFGSGGGGEASTAELFS